MSWEVLSLPQALGSLKAPAIHCIQQALLARVVQRYLEPGPAHWKPLFRRHLVNKWDLRDFTIFSTLPVEQVCTSPRARAYIEAFRALPPPMADPLR